MKRILIILSLSLLSTTLFANPITTTHKHPHPTTPKNAPKAFNAKPSYSILGHPIGTRDNYTINSNQEKEVGVKCVFINTSDKPVNLNIWTSPALTTPKRVMHLEQGSHTKPFQVTKDFLLKLQKNWWCRIYTPQHQEKQWSHCAYFSISDASIIENNPFASWEQKNYSEQVSYHCRIKNPKNGIGFFFYKDKEPS